VVATAAAGADLVVEQLLVLLQAENRSAPRPGAMRADSRSSCPLLPVVDRSVPGVRGPTAAQTGQQMVRQVRPGSPATGLVGSPKDAVARPGPGPADAGAAARPVRGAARRRPGHRPRARRRHRAVRPCRRRHHRRRGRAGRATSSAPTTRRQPAVG